MHLGPELSVTVYCRRWSYVLAVLFRAGVKPQDCYDIKHKLDAQQNGIYSVYVGPNKKCIKVYCDMETDGGGWTVCIEMFRVHSTQNNKLNSYCKIARVGGHCVIQG